MPDDSDVALVLKCRGGDRHAFEILLVRYQAKVFSAAYRVLNHREDAIDVTQIAFLRAYERLGQFDTAQPFAGWLYRIAVNEALDQVRGRPQSESYEDDVAGDRAGPDQAADQDASDAALQAALMELKVEYRTVIVLKHLQGCSYEEIAQILDCPVKTVKSRLFTARQALRDVLVAGGMA